MLKKKDPGLCILISYADANQGHLGDIYQAGNWIYTGVSARVPLFRDKSGKFIHDRACSVSGYKRQFGAVKKVPKRENLIRIDQLPKWRYFYALNDDMRKRILPLAKPYPKRAASETVDTPGDHSGKRGSTPTAALHSP